MKVKVKQNGPDNLIISIELNGGDIEIQAWLCVPYGKRKYARPTIDVRAADGLTVEKSLKIAEAIKLVTAELRRQWLAIPPEKRVKYDLPAT